MSVRVSPYLLSLIDWATRTRIRCASSSSRSPRACCPTTPSSVSTRCTSGPTPGARAHPPLRRQGAVPAARHLPGLLPLLHPQLRRGHRHRGGREGPAARSTTSAGSRPSTYIASRPELEDIVISGGDAYQLRAEQITLIGEALLDIDQHPAHALRHQGAGGDAAEDPHRRRLARRAHRRGREGPQAATRRSCCTPTSTTPTRSPPSPRRPWTGCSSAASPCATRRCCSAASTTRRRR